MSALKRVRVTPPPHLRQANYTKSCPPLTHGPTQADGPTQVERQLNPIWDVSRAWNKLKNSGSPASSSQFGLLNPGAPTASLSAMDVARIAATLEENIRTEYEKLKKEAKEKLNFGLDVDKQDKKARCPELPSATTIRKQQPLRDWRKRKKKIASRQKNKGLDGRKLKTWRSFRAPPWALGPFLPSLRSRYQFVFKSWLLCPSMLSTPCVILLLRERKKEDPGHHPNSTLQHYVGP